MTATLEDVQKITINQWGSLNTVTSPGRLTNGQSPDNQNVWVDEKPGSLVTAKGFIRVGNLPAAGDGLPGTFMIDYFKTSDGSQSLVASNGIKIWTSTDFVNWTEIKVGLSPFFQLRGMVIRNKLWMTNGSDPVMTWDGATLVELDGSGGKPDVPLAKYISYHDERVWLYGINGDPSSLRFADLADSSGTEIEPDNASAWPADNEIQVSEGDDDIGTGLFLYRGYLYASKSFSVWRIVGYDEYTYTKVKTRASTGTRFQESVQILDNLVHFIGVDGFYTFDGEEAKRISDIIDPASATAGTFAFRNLQQPLLNNNFSNTSETADWDAGTFPATLDTANDRLTLVPADDSQADFVAGVTKTNIDTSTAPGSIQLTQGSSGQSSVNLADGQAATITGSAVIGSPGSLTDGGLVAIAGMFSLGVMTVNLSSSVITTSRIILKSLAVESGNKLFFYRDSTLVTPISISGAPYSINGDGSVTLTDAVTNPAPGPVRDVTFNFTSFTASQVSLRTGLPGAGTTSVRMTEFQVWATAYSSTGRFVSKTIDYGAVPASFGSFAVGETLNGETTAYFTQSSADGSSWDSELSVISGASIPSTVRRYLRWGVDITSSGATPVIDKVFVGGTYISPIIDTGGDINQWGAFASDQFNAGQTINAYYRAATTSPGIAGASWVAIVPGAVPAAAVTDVFIQIRLELSTDDATEAPYVESFTVNWVVGTNAGVNTNQNVASIVIQNRYWLAAATLGAAANDVVIVRGKSTFGSPWQKKDFPLLAFCRYRDFYLAFDSVNGGLIYRLESSYAENTFPMSSYFETQDFGSDSGFLMKVCEIHVTLDRTGPYDLFWAYSLDGGESWTESAIDLTRETLTTSLSFTKKLNVSFMSDSFRLRFRNTTVGTEKPFSIDSVTVFYRLTPFRGSL